ncbi:MAG: PepSY domain-containing protein [Chitinophagaceae bacterium]|nr:PepSY domain-containing protein [Chitinophagaceae bacterium]
MNTNPINKNESRKQQAKTLRVVRKIHRVTGLLLFIFFFIVGISGILLGWKKHTGNLLLPKTYKGVSINSKDWLSIDSLKNNAIQVLKDSCGENLSTDLDRIDIRPDKGSVKFIFTEQYREIQLDATTGEVLHIGKRHSDLIERIHDGSIVDISLSSKKGLFKVIYTSILGIALVLFTITGFWLWYGPKRMRRD